MYRPSISYPADTLETLAFDNGPDFFSQRSTLWPDIQQRLEKELSIVDDSAPVRYPGQCGICRKDVEFSCDWHFVMTDAQGRKKPHWRERLVCPCGLNARLRGALHFMLDRASLVPSSRVYLTEQTTPFYSLVSGYCLDVVGSEYLSDGTQNGKLNARGLRHEDITNLTFAAETFDVVGSFEVLEHVPDYRAGLREMRRILKPNGHLVATFPFRLDLQETLVRAKIRDDGSIEHLLAPEFHGDPVSEQGILCYYHFGWSILDEMRAAGFSKARCHLYWSWEQGYLGGYMVLFHAIK
jgi:SAM-dependent methyltransferase